LRIFPNVIQDSLFLSHTVIVLGRGHFRHVCKRSGTKPESLPSELGSGVNVDSGADWGTGVADAGALVGAGTGAGVVGTGASVGAGTGESVPAAVSQQYGGRDGWI